MCTIRQKPEKLIHCIIWAKALYEGLYGGQYIENFTKDIFESITQARTQGDISSFVRLVFQNLFFNEPNQLKTSHQGKLDNGETKMTDEERDILKGFISKLKTIKFEDFQDHASELAPGEVTSHH